MSRRVVITGLGTVSGLGIGIDALWDGVCEGRSSIDVIKCFDISDFECQIGTELPEFKIRDFVPKSYRKATKVMARDIELAVIAADLAVRDAGLVTPGVDAEGERQYDGPRMGCHIGAGLIAAEANELTAALVKATDENGVFNMHQWGADGMNHLTPLWLLKYLPNMLACHVTIIHEAQGPSNTITCAEASGGLSVGESLRVIERNAADICFCGGAESKMNIMTFYRQQLTGRLTTQYNDHPAEAVRPFDQNASGMVTGEGGGIIMLEAKETADQRDASPYAELIGFGASHTINPENVGLEPDAEGTGIASAMRSALRDAETTPDAINAIIAFGSGQPACDAAEVSAIKTVFTDDAGQIPIWSSKPFVGNTGAGAGGIDVALAAKMIREQTIPARINCNNPIADLQVATADATKAELQHIMVVSTSLGGQNVALILKRV